MVLNTFSQSLLYLLKRLLRLIVWLSQGFFPSAKKFFSRFLDLGDRLSALRCSKEILDDCEKENDSEEDEHAGEWIFEWLLVQAK